MTDRKKILVVDDSSTARTFEQMILGKGAFAVVTAKDGEEALLKARGEKPDLILMDFVMPGMSGVEVVRQIRLSDPRTPIIMVTTRSEPGNVELAYAAGCTDYVMKPVDAQELLAKVRSCLEGGERP